VLLYQVVKCRNSERLSLDEQMRAVFDQHTEMDHDGIVTGGKGKLFCLRDGDLGEPVCPDACQNSLQENYRGIARSVP
jgi:hypothetical protein